MMDIGRLRFRIGLVIICLAVGVTFGTVAVFVDPVDAQSTSMVIQPDGLDADEIRISIGLREDGSAEWSLEFWSTLDDEESTEAFESLQADIRNDSDSYAQGFADRIETTVATASNATGREMTADDFSVTTDRQSLGREYGIVRYAFDWSGFARTDGQEIYAGDAIEGLYIDDGTRLLVSWPTGYDPLSTTPEPDDHRQEAVIWHGATTDFISGEPRIVLTPSRTGFGLILGPLAGVLGAIVLLVGAAGWLLRRRLADSSTRGSTEISTQESENATATDVTETDTEPTETDTEPTETDTESSTQDSTEAATETSQVDDQESDPDGDSDPETALLSNEEQVMKLLEANDGRMKQQTAVKELGWTDAKTSKVVSGLREDGTIESFRIGRENVLRVPDSDTESDTL
jgi:hypothetical protein